jgi:hypothetical protein
MITNPNENNENNEKKNANTENAKNFVKQLGLFDISAKKKELLNPIENDLKFRLSDHINIISNYSKSIIFLNNKIENIEYYIIKKKEQKFELTHFINIKVIEEEKEETKEDNLINIKSKIIEKIQQKYKKKELQAITFIYLDNHNKIQKENNVFIRLNYKEKNKIETSRFKLVPEANDNTQIIMSDKITGGSKKNKKSTK